LTERQDKRTNTYFQLPHVLEDLHDVLAHHQRIITILRVQVIPTLFRISLLLLGKRPHLRAQARLQRGFDILFLLLYLRLWLWRVRRRAPLLEHTLLLLFVFLWLDFCGAVHAMASRALSTFRRDNILGVLRGKEGPAHGEALDTFSTFSSSRCRWLGMVIHHHRILIFSLDSSMLGGGSSGGNDSFLLLELHFRRSTSSSTRRLLAGLLAGDGAQGPPHGGLRLQHDPIKHLRILLLLALHTKRLRALGIIRAGSSDFAKRLALALHGCCCSAIALGPTVFGGCKCLGSRCEGGATHAEASSCSAVGGGATRGGG
jgi:hypothetical protein